MIAKESLIDLLRIRDEYHAALEVEEAAGAARATAREALTEHSKVVASQMDSQAVVFGGYVFIRNGTAVTFQEVILL